MRLRTRASAALLGVSCAVGGVAALAVPAAHAQVRSAASVTASVPNSSGWHYAGKYYVQAKCHEDGKKEVLEGADDYSCEEVVDPDGTIAYWNLWVLFLPLRSA